MDAKTLLVLTGHASISFTMDTHAHVLTDYKRESMAPMEDLYGILPDTATGAVKAADKDDKATPQLPIPYRHAKRNLCNIFIASIDILINSLTITRNAQFIVALRKSIPKCVTDEVIDGGFCFLLVRPVVELRNPGFDLLQEFDCYLFDFLNIPPGEIFGEQQIVEGQFLIA